MNKTICLLPGDGIGPEILAQGVKVLEAVAQKYNHQFSFVTAQIGGAAIDATGGPLPDATVRAGKAAGKGLAGHPQGPGAVR